MYLDAVSETSERKALPPSLGEVQGSELSWSHSMEEVCSPDRLLVTLSLASDHSTHFFAFIKSKLKISWTLDSPIFGEGFATEEFLS